LFLPQKSDMGLVFTRLNKQLSTVKSTERKLFKKRQPDEEIE